MQTKMVASGKGPLAEVTLKRSVAGVFAIMPREFVRSGKFPSATFPVAVVRLLSRMGPQVRLQMRRLGVSFGAAGMRASVRRRSLPAPSSSSPLLRRRSPDVGAAEAQKGCADAAADTSADISGDAGAHRKKEIGELRRRRRRH